MIKSKFKNNKNVKLYNGDARITLIAYKLYNIKFDVVFFDASHHYEVDNEILNRLIPLLNKNAYIIFDDYDIDDVNKLVNKFKKNYCNKFNIIIQYK